MDIKPMRPFKKTLPTPQQGPVGSSNKKPPVAEGEPLKVPEELLGPGRKTPLLSAEAPGRPSRKKWWILGVLGLLVLVLVSAVVAGFAWYNTALQPRSSEAQRIRITIETGATPEQIADELEAKQVVKSSLAFQLLLRETGERDKLKAGTYLLSPDQSARDILAWLVGGKVDTFNVTIVPGLTLSEIKDNLIKDGFAAADINAAFTKEYDHPLLAYKPKDVSLDGYIYPETYQISSATTVEELLRHTFDEFYAQIEAKELKAKLSTRGFNLHQGITLASITQMETANATDQRQVAQVFEKRLQEGMQLGSDVTFMYAGELLGEPGTITIDSPYNTRRYAGLPPGAIANFNISALVAVAEPAAGDYLYFVAGDDGVTHFARTDAEHQANINRYCTKLCNE